MKRNERWQHLIFTAGSGFGNPDSWSMFQRIEGKFGLDNSEKRVRAGRDSAERTGRFYPVKSRVTVSAGDRMKDPTGKLWVITFFFDGVKKYIDLTAVQG